MLLNFYFKEKSDFLFCFLTFFSENMQKYK